MKEIWLSLVLFTVAVVASAGLADAGELPYLGSEACGTDHIRGDANTIPASGGFIRHHEQYNELLASPQAGRCSPRTATSSSWMPKARRR